MDILGAQYLSEYYCDDQPAVKKLFCCGKAARKSHRRNIELFFITDSLHCNCSTYVWAIKNSIMMTLILSNIKKQNFIYFTIKVICGLKNKINKHAQERSLGWRRIGQETQPVFWPSLQIKNYKWVSSSSTYSNIVKGKVFAVSSHLFITEKPIDYVLSSISYLKK